MLIYAYVFALVLGSVLLGASFLLGGKDMDGDHDVGDHGDAHIDHDHDHGLDGHGHDGHDTHGDLGGFFGVLASMRFWTFFAAFFGLTGIVLDGLDLAAPMLALGLAIAIGFLMGWTAVTLIRRLSADDTGVAATVDDYVGKSGEMLISAGPQRLGKIRIELKGTTVDVLAESDEQTIARGEQALIVEMRGAKAAVVKLDAARSAAQV
jgi:membrane protein implicated in regulation of membrane protease activity